MRAAPNTGSAFFISLPPIAYPLPLPKGKED